VLAGIFHIVALTFDDWMLVLAFSFPVILIDEVLKCIGRFRNESERKARQALETAAKKSN